VESKNFRLLQPWLFFCPFVSAKGRKPSAQTMARALFENTRNPGKKVASTSLSHLGCCCRISMCFQIHSLSGTAFGRARALALTNVFRWDKHFYTEGEM
jgi:hypothetical protein